MPKTKKTYNVHQWTPFIEEAARKYGVDSNLVKAVMETESHGDPNAGSPKGAAGLMQMMPGTARGYGSSVEELRKNPVKAIDLGVKHLAGMIAKYDGDERFAIRAYNAGTGNMRKYKNAPPFRETRKYEEKVFAAKNRFLGGAEAGYIFPVQASHYRMTSSFGETGKSHPRPHTGIDIAVPTGTPIMAMRPGRVIEMQEGDKSYGRYIKVDEGGGVVRQYSHLHSFEGVTVGGSVYGGQKIALSGGGREDKDRGVSTGAHLDVKKIVNGKPVNFMSELTGSTAGAGKTIPYTDSPAAKSLMGIVAPITYEPTNFETKPTKALQSAAEEPATPAFNVFNPMQVYGDDPNGVFNPMSVFNEKPSAATMAVANTPEVFDPMSIFTRTE